MSDAGLGFMRAFTEARRLKLDKAKQAEDIENSKADREFRQEQIAETRRIRDLGAARRSDLVAASASPDNPADGPPRPAPRPFEAMESAANKRLAAGDLDGYNDLVGKAAAAKTFYYTTAFQNAYRSGDRNAALGVLNDFPNGQKYELQDADDGGVVMLGYAQDGRPLGSRKYKSNDEFFADMQSRINPGDIAKTIREKIEFDTRQKFTQAQTAQVEANTQTENATRQGKIDLANANIRQSDAAAAASRASAANAGATPEMRNFGFAQKLTPEQREQFYNTGRSANQTATDATVLATQTALLDAYTDPIKRSLLSPDDIKVAEGLMARARGNGLVRKNSVGNPSPQENQGVPANPADRKAGAVYDTPKGKLKWTGTGWLPAN